MADYINPKNRTIFKYDNNVGATNMSINDVSSDLGALFKQLQSEVHVWFCFPEQITDQNLLNTYRKMLSKEESKRYQQFIFDNDRHSYLVAHALVRVVLSKYTDIEPADWQFEMNDHGRPEIEQGLCDVPLRFNLTHTKGLCACIVTLDAQCGIDAEYTTRKNDLLKVAQRMFSPNECMQLQRLNGATLSGHFFRYWTLREAYVKAIGTGLSGSSNDFEFEISGNSQISIGFNAAQKNDSVASARWRFELFEPTQQHITAIAVLDEDKTLSVVRHNIVP